MLNFLAINNVVLIDKAEISFGSSVANDSNLCILSGETGSGKSILLDALGLAIGFRSNARLIGANDDKASVLAEFKISKNEICRNLLKEHELLDAGDADVLRIRRVISENAANKIYVNDVVIGVNLLAQIGETLVEIHGQHDQRGLLNPTCHGEILDNFANNNELLVQLKKLYEQLKNIDKKIEEFQRNKAEIEREKDYLQHVIKELQEADIKELEEQELVTKKERLTGKEKILRFIAEFKNNLLEASSSMALAQKVLLRNSNVISNYLAEQNEEFEKISSKIDEGSNVADDVISRLDTIERDVANEEDDLAEIEERLFFIRSLARKFSVNVDGLANVLSESQEKLQLLTNQEMSNLDLENERKNALKKYQQLAVNLTAKRKEYAIKLAASVEAELQFLKMENTKFVVNVKALEEEEYYLRGNDSVRFSASINKNDFDDINKIASGGELSRFMLALKVALMDVRSTPTMIFDEIDTGIGGAAADAVGKRLKTLAKKLQILVVTHQPQIAAKADFHLKISKSSGKDGKIRTDIAALDKEGSVMEVARMLSGENITDEAIRAARLAVS